MRNLLLAIAAAAVVVIIIAASLFVLPTSGGGDDGTEVSASATVYIIDGSGRSMKATLSLDALTVAEQMSMLSGGARSMEFMPLSSAGFSGLSSDEPYSIYVAVTITVAKGAMTTISTAVLNCSGHAGLMDSGTTPDHATSLNPLVSSTGVTEVQVTKSSGMTPGSKFTLTQEPYWSKANVAGSIFNTLVGSQVDGTTMSLSYDVTGKNATGSAVHASGSAEIQISASDYDNSIISVYITDMGVGGV